MSPGQIGSVAGECGTGTSLWHLPHEKAGPGNFPDPLHRSTLLRSSLPRTQAYGQRASPEAGQRSGSRAGALP